MKLGGKEPFLIPVVSCSHAEASRKDGKPVPSTHGHDRDRFLALRVRVDDPGLRPSQPFQLSHFRLFTKNNITRASGTSHFAVCADVSPGTYRLCVCLCPGVLYCIGKNPVEMVLWTQAF